MRTIATTGDVGGKESSHNLSTRSHVHRRACYDENEFRDVNAFAVSMCTARRHEQTHTLHTHTRARPLTARSISSTIYCRPLLQRNDSAILCIFNVNVCFVLAQSNRVLLRLNRSEHYLFEIE